ncbi:replication factor C small subunit [Candidatus Bathyarchaeota archaeon]|nr:replication factor C small subunit [Candidatus Bathyarchaeota archaeon]
MSIELWTEKYRPRTLDEVVDHEEVISRLKRFVEERNIPHLLFVGPAGVGKTTTILALAQDLYGPGYMNFILELNASDERGINVIREKVKFFARTAPMRSEVPFKILIMDEADSLTAAAQHALRRTMERYTKTCRFCLIGNYSENIIEPIQSRCSVFRFGHLSERDIRERIRYIADCEGVKLLESGLDAILEASRGDLRKAINILQTAAASKGGYVDEDVVFGVLGRVSPKEVRQMLLLSLEGRFLEAREALRRLLLEEGLAGEDILRQIYSQVLRLQIPESWKVRLSEMIGEIDYRLTQGARPEIQLGALLAKLALAGEEMRR